MSMKSKSLSFAVVAFVGLLAFWLVKAGPAQATTPFTCDGQSFMVRAVQNAGQSYSHLYQLSSVGASANLNNEVNGPTGLTISGTPIADTSAFPSGYILNGLAYNHADKFFYVAHNNAGSSVGNNDIYRVGADGQMDLAYTAVGVGDLKGAAFSADGNTFYAIAGQNQHTLVVITGLTAAPGVTPTMTTLNLTDSIAMGDIVFNPASNTLYAMANNNNNFYTLNTTTGAATLVTVAGINSGLPSFVSGVGSLFVDTTGQMYGYVNSVNGSVGALVAVNSSNGKLTIIKNGPVTNESDGTSCVPVDNKIDVVKVAGTPSQTGSSSFSVNYVVKVGNLGLVSDPNIQVVDNLSQTFASGSPVVTVSHLAVTQGSCIANSTYNGTSDIRLLTGSDTLAISGTCTITFSVGLAYPSVAAVPKAAQQNVALASAAASGPSDGFSFLADGSSLPPADVLASDNSNDSASLPVAANGDPSNPTPVTLVVAATPVVPNTGRGLTPTSPLIVLAAALLLSGGLVLVVRNRWYG